MSEILREMQRSRSRERQVAENSARVATRTETVETTGHGHVRPARPVMFGLTFVERPVITGTGCELAAGAFAAGDFPLVQVLVERWVTNPRGHWIGAHLAVRVDSRADYRLRHHVTFAAVAIKGMSGTEGL